MAEHPVPAEPAAMEQQAAPVIDAGDQDHGPPSFFGNSTFVLVCLLIVAEMGPKFQRKRKNFSPFREKAALPRTLYPGRPMWYDGDVRYMIRTGKECLDMELETKELLDLSHTLAGEYLAGFQYPWQALDGIKELILTLGAALPPEEYDQPAPQVWVHKTAVVFPTAYLGAPCIIGPETEVRHCAFIRGSALVGAHCVVGNSVELKNVILFDNVQTPHYNYVGDSILGYKSHMGAGSITSNVKSDKTLVTVKNGAERIETGRKKFGAILGDHVEVGCNSVLNPGTVVGRGSSIYPVSCVRGAIPAGSIVKTGGVVVQRS